MLIAYDSDNIDDIPTDAEIIAYYNDGEVGTATEFQLARHSTKAKYSISRLHANDPNRVKSYWKDVENGAATIDDFVADLKEGYCSGIYIQASRIPTELEPIMGELPPFDIWAASWGAPTLYPGSVWTQYASPTSSPPTNGHFDESYVFSNWTPKTQTPTEVKPLSNTVSPNVIVAETSNDLDETVRSPSGVTLNAPCVAIVPTPSGNGYYVVGSDGGLFCFGDAVPHPNPDGKFNLVGVTLAKPVIDFAVSKTGNGYAFLAMDGGVFAFGDFGFHGAV